MIENGKLWELIKFYDSMNYIMTGGTPSEQMWTEGREYDQDHLAEGGNVKGLLPGHAYALIAAKEH